MLEQNSIFPFIITPDIHEATHWMPVKDIRWTADGSSSSLESH